MCPEAVGSNSFIDDKRQISFILDHLSPVMFNFSYCGVTILEKSKFLSTILFVKTTTNGSNVGFSNQTGLINKRYK